MDAFVYNGILVSLVLYVISEVIYITASKLLDEFHDFESFLMINICILGLSTLSGLTFCVANPDLSWIQIVVNIAKILGLGVGILLAFILVKLGLYSVYSKIMGR